MYWIPVTVACEEATFERTEILEEPGAEGLWQLFYAKSWVSHPFLVVRESKPVEVETFLHPASSQIGL
jgi:hypothetical protein